VSPDYTGLCRALLPEAALVLGAFLVLGFDLMAARRPAETRLREATALGCAALVAALGLSLQVGLVGPVFGGVLILDPLAVSARLGVIVLALLTLGIAAGASRRRHPAEWVAIVLFATSGFMLMAAAQQLLLAFLALELASLSLYVVTGFDTDRPESAEAALKYFLFGGMSAAFLLFGFSLVYGLTGSIDLPQIASRLASPAPGPLLAVALVMVFVGFGFKTAAAPFHLWAPDVYEGAPAPSAALIASASKLAGIALFTRLLWPALGANTEGLAPAPGWLPVAAAVSVASILIGNLGALAQRNLRRLLAYSAIAHAGSLLLGVIAAGYSGPGPVFFYASTYGLATVGAFGVIAVIERTGPCQRITDLAGLHRRSPFLAACLAVFILSLAGIPPLAGFFGKFAVYAAALQIAGLSGPVGWLALFAILMSAVALYYYLIVLKQALVVTPGPIPAPIPVPLPAALALFAACAMILLFGVFPGLVLGFF
jgi:NADH-quinone oxidoreductase subunit N